jgi:pimeloyl-ACP methyl ester carboxylesterase
MDKLSWLACVAMIGLQAGCTAVAEKTAGGLVTEEFFVPARDPGIRLYVRNKHPANMTGFTDARTVLFVHGASYPSEATFDLELDGMSWMDYIAGRGFDVYMMDVRGYGRSARPREMSEAAESNAPIVRTDMAVRDVTAVVDAILARRKLSKIDLLGWSWGTVLHATFATQHPEKVNRLVLYAPTWARKTANLLQASANLGSYRTVNRTQMKERWLAGVPQERRSDFLPAGWFDAWADAAIASDPDGARQDPPVLRAPNGVVQDSREFGATGPKYDPSKITAPTLLVGAEWDADNPAYMRQALFPLLVNSSPKRYIELGQGTHGIMLERNRDDLFRAVQAFLEEDGGR